MKKAQTTLFIILGVALVIIVGSYMLFMPVSDVVEIKKGFDDLGIDPLIKGCIESEVDNALFLLGYQGGYIAVPENVESIDIFVSKVPYWLKDKKDLSLNSNFLEGEIEFYIDHAVLYCVDHANKQYELEFDSVDSDVKIFDDAVYIEMDMGITVKKGDVEKKTGKFKYIKDARFGKMLSEAKAIVDDLMDGKETIGESEFFVIAYDEGNNNYVYSIVDDSVEVRGNPYQFAFAVEIPPLENYPPVLSRIGVVKVKEGERIYIDYNATDDYGDEQLTYSLMSMTIPGIDRVNGIIDFTPPRAGMYQGLVSVIDGYGEEDHDVLIIEVES